MAESIDFIVKKLFHKCNHILTMDVATKCWVARAAWY